MNFDLEPEFRQKRLEAFVQRLAGHLRIPETEQEAQIDLVMVWVQAVLRKDTIIGCEYGAKW